MNALKRAERGHSPMPFPQLPRRMAELDEQFLGAATSTSANTQNAVSNIPPTRQRLTFALGGLALLAVIGITSHLWWQLQPKSSLPPVTAVIPTPTLAASAQASQEQTTATPIPSTPSRTVPVELPPQTLVQSASHAPAQPRTLAQTDSPVKLTRSPLRIHPLLAKGYEQFEQGQLAEARHSYEQVLKADPHSIDALHGMAALALLDNRPDIAEHFFQRALLTDPQDPYAIAGLANLRGHINPGATESRLRGLIAAQPELAAPQFALGNLLSSQERWAEAQQAYFKAYSADPANPDILFNLAVSLEHLRQSKLAAQYYALAIDAATKRPAGFDAAQASARLRALQP